MEANVAHNLRTQDRLARWPAASKSLKPQPHFLTICWDVTAEDGAPVTLQATLCKTHRQVIALRSASARGVRRQFGESRRSHLPWRRPERQHHRRGPVELDRQRG